MAECIVMYNYVGKVFEEFLFEVMKYFETSNFNPACDGAELSVVYGALEFLHVFYHYGGDPPGLEPFLSHYRNRTFTKWFVLPRSMCLTGDPSLLEKEIKILNYYIKGARQELGRLNKIPKRKIEMNREFNHYLTMICHILVIEYLEFFKKILCERNRREYDDSRDDWYYVVLFKFMKTMKSVIEEIDFDEERSKDCEDMKRGMKIIIRNLEESMDEFKEIDVPDGCETDYWAYSD